MRQASRPGGRWARRSLLGAAFGPLLYAARGPEEPSRARRFLDATTEFEVLRVTDPACNSWLPYEDNRALSRRGDSLIFASDSNGSFQLYRYEFKSNRVRPVTEAAALNRDTFTLTPGDKSILYIDGRKVMQGGNGSRDRVIHEIPPDWAQSLRLCLSDDGVLSVLGLSDGTRSRIEFIGRRGSIIHEQQGVIRNLSLRPKGSAVSFLVDGELRLATFDGGKSMLLHTAPGEVVDAHWPAGGSSVYYLLKPAGKGRLPEIRELVPETGVDILIARTSQFGRFQRNSDTSVFLGVSSSKASPHLLILLRSVKRELTICEHHCSDFSLTRAVFSPNNSRIAFQTDRHGKMCVYAMAVDRLIDLAEDA